MTDEWLRPSEWQDPKVTGRAIYDCFKTNCIRYKTGTILKATRKIVNGEDDYKFAVPGCDLEADASKRVEGANFFLGYASLTRAVQDSNDIGRKPTDQRLEEMASKLIDICKPEHSKLNPTTSNSSVSAAIGNSGASGSAVADPTHNTPSSTNRRNNSTDSSPQARATITTAASTTGAAASDHRDLNNSTVGDNGLHSEQAGGKAIIFIDEIDSLCGSRSNGDDAAERRVKNQFLQQMDGLLTNDKNKVLVLGATNIPWEFDLAMRRRLEKRVYISLPDAHTRAEMIKLHMGDTPNDLAESDFRSLGEITAGASGSDIKTMVKEDLMEPIRNGQKAKQFLRVNGHFFPCEQSPNCALCPADSNCKSCGARWMTFSDVPPKDLMVADVKVKDFHNVMTSSYSSTSPEELKKYDDWTKDFGKDGS